MSVRLGNDNSNQSNPHSIRSSSNRHEFASRTDKKHTSENNWLIDYLVPLMSETNRAVPINGFVHLLMIFWIMVQIFFGSFFELHPNAAIPKEMGIFQKVVFLGMDGSKSAMIPAFIVHTCICAITGLFIIGACIDFAFNHEYRKPILIVIRYWHGNLYNMCIIPNFLYFFHAIGSYVVNQTPLSIFFIVIGTLVFIYTLLHLNYLTVVLCHTPFLSNIVEMIWRPKPLFQTITIYAFSIGTQGFFYTFSDWVKLTPQIVTICVAPLTFYNLLNHPFSHTLNNSIWVSFPIPIIVSSLLSMIYNYASNIFPVYLLYAIPAIILIISTIISYIIMTFKRKSIVKKLSYYSINEDNETISDEMKFEYLNIHFLNKNQGFYALQVGVEEACDLFLDFSLSRHLINRFPEDSSLLIFNIWVISFFPGETNVLHSYITLAFRILDLSYEDTILFFQLHRVHIFRQSSASKEATVDFSKIRRITDSCVSQSCHFWKNLANPTMEIDQTSIEHLTKLHRQADQVWYEVLDKYPNNSRFANEYSRFLLDSKCDFNEAVKWHQRALAIEGGKRFQTDRMFRCFIQMFPHYLKKGIVDSKGCLRKHKSIKRDDDSSSSNMKYTNNSQNATDTMDSDDQIDMEMAANYLPQLQLRFALQNFTQQLTSDVSNKVMIYAVVRLIVTIVYVTAAVLVIHDCFEEKSAVFTQLSNFNNIEFSTSIMSVQIAWLLFSSYNTTYVPNVPMIKQILGNVDDIPYYIDYSQDHRNESYWQSRDGLQNINIFAKQLYESYAMDLGAIDRLADIYSEYRVRNAYCYTNATFYYDIDSVTIDFLIRGFFTNILKQVGAKTVKINGWPNSDNYCELFIQNWHLQEVYINLSERFSSAFARQMFEELNPNSGYEFSPDPQMQVLSSTDQVIVTCSFFLSFTPFLLLFLSLPSISSLSHGIKTEHETYLQALKGVGTDECIKASTPIQSDAVKTNSEINFTNNLTKNSCPMWLISFITSLVIITLIVAITVYTMTLSGDLDTLREQFNVFAIQRNLIYDLGRDSLYLVFASSIENSSFYFVDNGTTEEVGNFTWVKSPGISKFISNTLEKYNVIQSMIQLGFQNVKSAIGFNKDADDYRFEEVCTPKMNSKFEVDYYKCISFDRLLAYFVNQIKLVQATYGSMNMFSQQVYTITHMLDSRLALGFQRILELYREKFDQNLSLYKVLTIAALVVALLLAIASFLTELIILSGIMRQLDTFKSIVMKLNPISFVSTISIMSLFNKSKNRNENSIKSAAQAVFHTSHNAMISMNADGIIEHLNDSATKIFGYTPEQMLGQNLKLLINPETSANNSQLFYTMQLMTSGQCSLINESKILGQRDDGTSVPLLITLLGFSSNDRVAESFALICVDQTQEEMQIQAVENAKRQSELILLQILPKDIITRLNRGDQDISFTVNSASIIFIDIEKFSIYSASLSANDIMTNLSKIFTTFDKIVASFELITKIKLIGDIYMAAGGLFSPDLEPNQHANQVLQFSLQALEAIEELNIQLNASLQVRIGINSGGPLIAGVLGTDRPLFDIIGDPINIAARLQSTDVPGLVQISQGCYDLVANGPYKIEQRGEIELKGKGKRMTYLVYPQHDDYGGLISSSSRVSLVAGEDELHKSHELLTSILSNSFEIKQKR